VTLNESENRIVDLVLHEKCQAKMHSGRRYYAINANAIKTIHEANCAIAIASFMNGTSVALALLSCVRCALKSSLG